MVFRPRDEDTIYTSLRDRLTGKISGLTNFVSGSFNDVWTASFSQGLRENELQASAGQLSGWIEYSGGPITESDLEDLDMENVDPEELNQYIDDQDLDELVQIVGLERDPGNEATGDVTFTTVSAKTQIPEGTEIGTQPDATGNFLRYITTEDAETTSGVTDVTVPVIADEVGEDYNVGANTITYLPAPPTGIQAVTNNNDITGGIDRETNDELRERAKEAVFATSGGGTESGIIGYIQQNTEARDVLIEEFTSQQPPYADVIVDGGDDTAVQDAIDFSKPVGIKHNLIRPTIYTISMEVDVTGQDIDTTRIEDDLTDFVNGLGINDDFYRDKVFQIIFNSDEDIINTERLDVLIIAETHTFDATQNIYQLDKGSEMEQDNNVREVRGTLSGSSHTFVKGTDYTVIDDSGDGKLDAIDWSIGGDNPDDGTDFFVDYEILEDITFEAREKGGSGTMTVTVV